MSLSETTDISVCSLLLFYILTFIAGAYVGCFQASMWADATPYYSYSSIADCQSGCIGANYLYLQPFSINIYFDNAYILRNGEWICLLMLGKLQQFVLASQL